MKNTQMLSKFGRMCDKKLYILKYKDTILSEQPRHTRRRSITVSSTQPTIPRLDYSTEISSQELSSKTTVQPNASSSPRKSSAFLSQSRDEFYRANGRKEQAPPAGHYNCNYSVVDRYILTRYTPTPKYSKKFRKTNKKNTNISSSLEDISINYSAIMPHISAPMFDKQTSRKEITACSPPVNELRFVKFNDTPHSLSKYKRTSTPDISKYKERDEVFIKKFNHTPIYDPKYTIVEKNPGKTNADFTKCSPRKPIILRHMNDVSYSNISFKLIEKR